MEENTGGKRDIKHRTYIFAIKIIKVVDKLNSGELSAQVIAKQILRSATSIGANIIEAQAGSSSKDFVNFYHHSLKSANETKFWLGLLRDTGKYKKEIINDLLIENHEIANIIATIIIKLKNKKQ